MSFEISSFNESIDLVVNNFRQGHEAQANENLAVLTDLLIQLISDAPEEFILKCNPLIAACIEAVEHKNYLWAADILSYEIAPLIRFLITNKETTNHTKSEQNENMSVMKSNTSLNFSPKGQKLINMYAQMAESGYERTDHSLVEDAFSDFELRGYRTLVKKIFDEVGISSVLDYGCGGSDWSIDGFDSDSNKSACEFFNLEKAYRYEPARELDERLPVDCVISFDVLEHIFITDVPLVLRDMFRYANKLLFLNIACYPAAAKLPNGENAHITVREPIWWKGMLDSISIEFPEVKVYLMCSTGWRDSTAFPIWHAQSWQDTSLFVINP